MNIQSIIYQKQLLMHCWAKSKLLYLSTTLIILVNIFTHFGVSQKILYIYNIYDNLKLDNNE